MRGKLCAFTVTMVWCFTLTACKDHLIIDPSVSGEPLAYTHISSDVREGILKKTSALFKAATGCKRIEQIDISVKNIRMMFSGNILNGKTLQILPSGGFLLDEQEIPPNGYVQENDELWQVSGCKTHRDFTVKFFGDDKGATYFGVFDPEKHPAPDE
ncbi:MAG: hypothetical protein FWG26_00070 [Betaproteobacteria bacterium]|nr:hypothetical protein [Betaproteobacteria bacterium]